jgi:lysyl-tRNA synthetase class 2
MWDAVRSPVGVSRIVCAIGLLTLYSALSPEFRDRVALVYAAVPDVFPAAATTGAAAVGVMLVVLSRALRRGKFRAWLLAVVLVSLAAVLHLLKGLDLEESALCLVVLGVLVGGRGSFTARPDPLSLRRVGSALLFGPPIAIVIGFLWLTVNDDSQRAGTTVVDRLIQAVVGLVGFTGPVHFQRTAAATHAAVALAVLGAAVIVVALWVALQPAGGPHPLSPDEGQRLRRLISRWGGEDSLAYFALRDDRSAIFAPSGNAVVTYRVVGAVSLAAGDPIGECGTWPSAVAAWLEEARSFGWIPAVIGASELGAAAYQKAGLDVLELGDEAIVSVADFTLEGKAMKGVRNAAARCERAGVTVSCDRMSSLTPAVINDVAARADHWRDTDVERGFSMALGRFGAPRDQSAVLVRALRDGELVGMLHLVPWGEDGLSLDLMRRDSAGENGIVEAMVAGLMESAPQFGVRRVSLNFAVFRSAFARGERIGAGPVTRMWRALLLYASRFWQIESLYRANAKYRPQWQPRFVAYRSPSDLPRVLTAILRAEAFLVAPGWYRRIGRP